MQSDSVIYEQVRFGPEEYLAGVLGYPAEGEPTWAALVCSPHPNFGGDLENNVVAALAQRLCADAVTLRFDYRGVGQSRIDLPPGLSAFDYWENLEQTLNYTDPEADTAAAADELSRLSGGLPMVAVGYSFGSIMATRLAVGDGRILAAAGIAPPLKRIGFEHLADSRKPCLLVSGRDDFVYDDAVAQRLVGVAGRQVVFDRPDADHFFVGAEAAVADRVARFARAVRSRLSAGAVHG